jgi:hypothetical protein
MAGVPPHVPRPGNRIKIFLALPVASLDRMSLARQVEAIGRMRPDEAEDRAS